jgi:hypothetical protein
LTIAMIAPTITSAKHHPFKGWLMLKRFIPVLVLGIIVLALFSALAVSAVDVSLSVNSGAGNSVWFISGEPSLIINGFDLSRFGVTLPATVRSISISVSSPVPGQPVEAVVYQDANGGSPVDAQLVGRRTVDITTAGVFTATFDTQVTQPVIWVGFYLPVGLRFFADTSGSSVLTYWGWRPGEIFDLASLANATVLGPSDGTAPVLINMGGVARITALVSTSAASPTATGAATLSASITPGGPATPAATQVAGITTDSSGYLLVYPNCNTLLRDRGDLVITLREQFGLECQLATRWDILRLQPAPQGYVQRGSFYNLTAYVNGRSRSSSDTFVAAVTHCIIADVNDLNRGIVGVAWDLPRNWQLLTTVRYENMLCAEFLHPGFVTYFIPIS